MKTVWRLFLLFFVFYLSHCRRDHYIGMFKRNDFLVAQDRVFKEKVPFRRVVAKYGRVFKCPITYFRVVDRLGYGGGPNVEVIRGGLRKKYIVARLTSPYNIPISVNVYIGCENKMTTTRRRITRASTKSDTTGDVTSPDSNNSTDVTAEGKSTTVPAGDQTTTDAANDDTKPSDNAEETTTEAVEESTLPAT